MEASKYILLAFMFLSLKKSTEAYTAAYTRGYPVATSSGCGMTSCPSCPDGYQIYKEYVYPCRCFCQYYGATTESTGKRLSKSLLLGILQNLQSNADALEQMAKGLGDEADLAQDAAGLPYN